MEIFGTTQYFEWNTGSRKCQLSRQDWVRQPMRRNIEIAVPAVPHDFCIFKYMTSWHRLHLPTFRSLRSAPICQSPWFTFAVQRTCLARKIHKLNGSGSRFSQSQNSINARKFKLISNRRIKTSEYRIFLAVVRNTECKEPRIRDQLPAKRRRLGLRSNGFQTPEPEHFLRREGFALLKSTSVELTCCSNSYRTAMLGTAAVLPLFGSRADVAFLQSHRRRTVTALMSATGAR
jgi:hypothetical protein